MTEHRDLLARLSDALAARTRAASSIAVAVCPTEGHRLSGTLWQPDVVVTSEQSFPSAGACRVKAASGAELEATVAGRDPGTNVAALRLASPLPFTATATAAGEPHTGALALACGADERGAPTARLALLNAVGPEWRSRGGGRIERRIELDARLSRHEEGGPVLDAAGALLGMSTFGPPGRVLVIPSATLDRVVPRLLRDGYIPRAWLGLALQPVAVPEALRDAAGRAHAMMVMSVAEGGPAAWAGVMTGDILLALDGAPVGRFRDLAAVLDPENVGREVELRLIRAGAVTTLRLTIGARPQRG